MMVKFVFPKRLLTPAGEPDRVKRRVESVTYGRRTAIQPKGTRTLEEDSS